MYNGKKSNCLRAHWPRLEAVLVLLVSCLSARTPHPQALPSFPSSQSSKIRVSVINSGEFFKDEDLISNIVF